MRTLSYAAVAVGALVAGLAIATVDAQQNTAARPGQGGARSSPPAPSAAALRVGMPPMPNPGYAPGRPIDVAHTAYKFAAEHPEILKYVPCYCGCESGGHNHNESCFVKRRDAKGNVLEWDTHGYG